MKIDSDTLRAAFAADAPAAVDSVAVQQAGLALFVALSDGQIEMPELLKLLRKCPEATAVLVENLLTGGHLSAVHDEILLRRRIEFDSVLASTLVYLMAWCARQKINLVANRGQIQGPKRFDNAHSPAS